MWEWHALGHIPLSDSYNPIPHNGNPWDYIHVNSADPGTSNDLLISARNSWALYDIDLKTGTFNWQMGGKHSTFKLGPGAKTYWQHDAEWQPGGLISVFDNGSTPPKEKQSRGVLLKPDYGAKTVALAKAFTNPTKTLLAPAQGNTLSLPGGDWLMGYGNLPNFTEYDSAGHVLLDGTLGTQRAGLQDLPGAVERPAGNGAGRGRQAQRIERDGEHQLERRDGRRLVAGVRRLLADPAGAGDDRAEKRLSDDGDRQHKRFLHRDQGAGRQRQRARRFACEARRLSPTKTARAAKL